MNILIVIYLGVSLIMQGLILFMFFSALRTLFNIRLGDYIAKAVQDVTATVLAVKQVTKKETKKTSSEEKDEVGDW